MDDEIDRLMISVRADTSGFARDVAALRGSLEDGLGAGADRAGRAIEASLLRAVKSGQSGFDTLKQVALAALSEIAAAALRAGINSLFGGSGGGGGGGGGGSLGAALASLIGGQPGRATGGPVSPGRAYLVGERGPELFVPTASGRVDAAGAGAPREVRVAITVTAGRGEAPAALAQSSRQVARAVKAALEG